MFIESLDLLNFKAIGEAHFNFREGVTVFSGNNGEGKSTVLNAINILLFNAHDLSFEDYIKWGNNEFNIRMTFSHEGKRYEEDFSYSVTKGSTRVFRSVETGEEWKNSAAIQKLDELIKPELAKASIVSAENEQNLITTTPAKRREYLKGVYDLSFEDQLKQIASDYDSRKQVYNDINAEINAKSSLRFSYLEKKVLSFTKEERDSALAQKSALEDSLRASKSIADELTRLETQKNNLGHSLNNYVSKKNNIFGKLSENQKKLEIARSEGYEEIDLSKYDKELDDLNKRFEEESTVFDTQIREIENKIAELEKTPVDKREETLGTEVQEKSIEISALRSLIKDSERRLQVLLKGTCPTCGHVVSEKEVNEAKELLNVQQSEVEQLLKEYDEIKHTLNEVKDKNFEHQRTFDTLNRTIEKLHCDYEDKKKNFNYCIKMEEAEKEQSALVNKNAAALHEEKINTLKTLISSSEQELESVNKLISDIQNDLDAVEKQIDSIDFDPEKERLLKEQIDEISNKISQYDKDEAYNSYVDEYNRSQCEKEEANLNEIKDLKVRLEEVSERMTVISLAKNILSKDFPSFVISRMVTTLQTYINEFLEKVYPKYQISIGESKNSLAITYGENNSDVKMASGFEKSAFSLAYMYALGKIQDYGLLIIDEGDAAASPENSMKFYGTLGKSKEYFPQIFVITHKEEAKELLRNDYHADVYTVAGGVYSSEN